jgi:hypothetical protein
MPNHDLKVNMMSEYSILILNVDFKTQNPNFDVALIFEISF